MKRAVLRWIAHPAPCWQFWYPQSGAVGGIILYGVLMAVAFAFAYLS